jgi:type II secretory pathway pseudopilin PulG
MKLRRQQRKPNPASGFSLVEVLIAAIILFIMLLSANKALLLGMAGTRQGASRTTLESEILNDIEVIQGIDSSLSADLNGCGSGGGSAYLKTKVESLDAVTSDRSWQRILDSSEPTILTITYSFSIPEATGTSSGAGTNGSGSDLGTGIEKRVVEINPSFLTECPT